LESAAAGDLSSSAAAPLPFRRPPLKAFIPLHAFLVFYFLSFALSSLLFLLLPLFRVPSLPRFFFLSECISRIYAVVVGFQKIAPKKAASLPGFLYICIPPISYPYIFKPHSGTGALFFFLSSSLAFFFFLSPFFYTAFGCLGPTFLPLVSLSSLLNALLVPV
jgi:hypothetical protein